MAVQAEPGWQSFRPFPGKRAPVSFLLAMLLVSSLFPGAAAGQEPSALEAAALLEKSLVEAIARAERSVVAIARIRKEARDPMAGVLRLDELPEIPAPLNDREPTDPDFVPTEFGSGVVVDPKGLILTPYHVLGDVKQHEYVVWLQRKPYVATVKAADPWLDLAVLKISAESLEPIPLGDGAAVKKGQIVVVLGNPQGIARDGEPSASWGIVANLARKAPAPGGPRRAAEGRETLHHYGTLIQTDARLEYGASGAAVVNLKGEMIGLATALAGLTGGEKSGGFAMPVNDDFRRALEALKAGRAPEYGFLGVAPTFLAVNERQQGRHGARVLDIVPGTPAAKAGLQTGDVVTHVDREPVWDDLDFIRRLSGLGPNTTVSLTVLRRGSAKASTVPVRLSKKLVEGARPAVAEQPPPRWRGLQVDYATASPRFREVSRDLDPAGCVGIVEVERDSPAWSAGLRTGDFVSHVGRLRVSTPDQFFAAVGSQAGEVSLRLALRGAPRPEKVVPPR